MVTSLPSNTVLYDVALSGYSPVSSGIDEITNADALENALKLFLLADQGDYLGNPGRGGWIKRKLLKPMRTVDALDLKTSIELALKTYFVPSLDVYNLQVIADLVKRLWTITFTYVIPSLKMSGTFSEQITGRV